MKALIMNFFKNEEGLETVEWGVMLFLIIVGMITVVGLLRDEVVAVFQTVIGQFQAGG